MDFSRINVYERGQKEREREGGGGEIKGERGREGEREGGREGERGREGGERGLPSTVVQTHHLPHDHTLQHYTIKRSHHALVQTNSLYISYT